MKSDITSFSKANKSRDVKFIIAISKNPQASTTPKTHKLLPLQKLTTPFPSSHLEENNFSNPLSTILLKCIYLPSS